MCRTRADLAITLLVAAARRRSFPPAIHELRTRKPRVKAVKSLDSRIDHCPAWSPRGEAAPPISFKRDE